MTGMPASRRGMLAAMSMASSSSRSVPSGAPASRRHGGLDAVVRPSDEVATALAEGRAVVALESTIISHGMPYPQNLEVGRRLEREVRASGAVPATIAVIDGAIRIGLDDAQLERLATEPAVKISRRDLPIALAQGRLAATTVASTMIGAALAGIRVFGTGGIGGVHRGVEATMDISADLHELARTEVIVVSAGAKSILDLPRTLEVLETLGVPVLGYGTDDFPAFFTRSSGLPVDARVDTPEEVAAIARAKWALGLGGGLLVANPIADAFALPAHEVAAHIDAALDAAAAQHVSGKDVTPFLLQFLVQATGGRTLAANVELAPANASLAGRIAVALAAG